MRRDLIIRRPVNIEIDSRGGIADTDGVGRFQCGHGQETECGDWIHPP